MLVKLLKTLSHLSLPALHALGALLGRTVWLLSATFRDETKRNLAQALGREPDAAMLKGVARESGKQILEFAHMWLRPQKTLLASIHHVEGEDILVEAQQNGESVLLLTPHLGCFEMCAQYASTFGSITVLFRPPRKAELAPLMESGRARGNVQIAPADVSGVRRLVKALRNGEMVGMLPDQAPKTGEGVWANFFGKPAWTMTLAARLSQVKGVRVVMIWTERLPAGAGYVVHLSEPVEPMEGDIQARCTAINAEIERVIMRCPEQYLWSYKRYKHPGSVSPSLAKSEAS